MSDTEGEVLEAPATTESTSGASPEQTNLEFENVESKSAEGSAPIVPETGESYQAEESGSDGESDGGGDGESGSEEAQKQLEINFPENFSVDEAQEKAFRDIAENLGMDSESAQSLVDLYVKSLEDNAQAGLDLIEGWKAELKSDPDFGGEKTESTLANAARAMDKLLGPEDSKRLRQDADAIGFGNHPSLVRLLSKAGELLSEDTIEAPSQGQPAVTGLEKLYAPSQQYMNRRAS